MASISGHLRPRQGRGDVANRLQEISGDKLASYLGFPGELHMSDTPGTCPAQISQPVIFSHCHRIKYLGFHRETHLESSPRN